MTADLSISGILAWMNVEALAARAGNRLARRHLKGQLVWWWQRLDAPDDTRQPCWLERRQAISYMEGILRRDTVAHAGPA